MMHNPYPKFDPKIHHRKSIRLQGYDYSQAGAYFVTIVTYQRDCLFGKIIDGEMYINEYSRIVQKWWSEIPNHFQNVELGAFVIMPNHVHGIIWVTAERRGEVLSPRYNQNKNNLDADVDETSNQGGETPPLRKWTLGQIVAYFKYQSTKEMNHIETKMPLPNSGSGIITNTSSATSPLPASPKYDWGSSYLGEVPDRAVGVAIYRSESRSMGHRR